MPSPAAELLSDGSVGNCGMIVLGNDGAQVFVPDGAELDQALERTTHMAVGAHPDDLPLMGFHGIIECFGRADK
ncbi:MAG: hypothetical protein WBZ40_11535, partial [Acidimicrobiia bacterium]